MKWRRLVPLVAVSVLACHGEHPYGRVQTASLSGQSRTTLPRLTRFDAWRRCDSRDKGAVGQSDCGPTTIPARFGSIRIGECGNHMSTELDTVELLAYVPDCTDIAVERLAALAAPRNDATTLSDLAAAYYVRAQRNDQPSDLVRSLDAAEMAVTLRPRMAAARFNRALGLEALGFSDDAADAWETLRHDAGGGWAAEAQEHWADLTKRRTLSASNQWPLNVKRLPLVANAGDSKGVAALVASYPAAAQRYVEEEVLPAWAEAAQKGQAEVAQKHLALAGMIAAALSQLTKDPYLLESVDCARDTSRPEKLREAQIAFRDARRKDRSFDREKAAEFYRAAESAFAAAGSPMRLGAILGRVPALTTALKFDRALRVLEIVEQGGRRYPNILARVFMGRGYLYTVQGHYADAIANYGKAQALCASMHDDESLVNVNFRKIGLFRILGQEDLTWREVVQAVRKAPALSEAQSRHAFLGENASSAVALGYPAVGLRYQDLAVQLLRNEMSRDPEADQARLLQLRSNLGIALRARASIRVKMRDLAGARSDLDEAIPLIGDPANERDSAIVSGLRARFAQVQAQLETTNRKRAIALLDEAIDHAAHTHYSTLLASLLIQRADLYRLGGQRQRAVLDLERAIEALRDEEQATLTGGSIPQSERIWSAYFSRYQETYRQLIALLIEDTTNPHADADAFAYAEKARAYEPLHRVLQRDDVPADFRKRLRGDEPLGLSEAIHMLPPETFLLQYCVLDDRTFVWLLWNTGFKRWTLPVSNDQIEEWTAALQRLADTRDRNGWTPALRAPFEGLLAAPIASVAQMHRGTPPARIVIVPDRAMHGLPFAALQNRDRHLFQDYRVAVAASATLFAFSLEQDRNMPRHHPESVLIVADPRFDPTLDVARNLGPLQNAQVEREGIEKIYQFIANVPPPLTKERATIPAFLKLAGRSTIIHIASHGVANPYIPSQSFLLLAPTKNDSGVLDAERLIGELRLDSTRLVVLSACSTAGGTHIGPEGIAPLVRPLIAAGVPGVVGTLWNVDDNTATAEVLIRFHRYYRDGKDADDALRLAQLEMFEDPDLARQSPRVWAPFQVIGYASSPFAPQSK